MSLKLTVLVDNNTFIDRYFLGEPALSIYLEADGQRILFDSGYSDAFLRNAAKMGIDLLQIDQIVLSHGHLDHTWGLQEWIRLKTEASFEKHSAARPTLTLHPHAAAPKSVDGVEEINTLLSEDTLRKFFNLQPSREPVWLTEHLVFLGEIPRRNPFEARHPVGKVFLEGSWQDDFVLDDTALAYQTPAGLVLITGCSHAGICNILTYARQVCGDQPILDVIGGFHLLQPSATHLQETLNYFQALHPQAVHACHCTDLQSKIALSQVCNLSEVGSGLILTFGE